MKKQISLIMSLIGVQSIDTDNLKCVSCEAFIDLVRPHVDALQTPVVDVSIPACIVTNGESKCSPNSSEGPWACKDLCIGMMNEESVQLVDLVNSFSSKKICENFANACGDAKPKKPVVGEPQIRSNLSDTKGERNDWDSWKNPTGTFVHITDLHLQLDYVENGNTDCGQPICCRSEGGEGKDPQSRAHRLGDWNCDLSPALFSTMVNAITTLPERPDFILNTGDDPAHDVWNQNHQSNLKAIEYVSKELLSGVGSKIPVVNTLGNHEHAPVNQYKGPGGDAWLYENASKYWSPWLSDDARRTMSYGGYYATRVVPGLIAVVMHSTMFNSGTGGNWAFMTNRTDIGAQFPWLLDVLNQAREREEKVRCVRA